MKSLRMCYKFLISIYSLIIIMQPNIIYGQTGKVIAVAGGESHSAALKDDGTVWAWGANGSGQIGDGNAGDNVLNPVQVVELTGYLTGITAITAGTSYWLNQGGHNLALKNDGTVWAWGYGLSGQLGDGAGISRSIPVQVVDSADLTGYLTDISSIGAGDYHSIAVKSSGTVLTWGKNDFGQLGDGTQEEKFTPVQVSGLTDVTAVVGGASHCLALKSNGTVWAWGANNGGQLGDGTSGWPASKATPVQVSGLTNIIAIEAGDEHSLALKSDGTVWAWGANPFGQLGDGTWGWPESKTTAVQVTDPSDPTGFLTNIIAIAGGDDYSLALKADGTVWGFGRNNWGQLGNGAHDDTNTPVQVSGLLDAVSIAAGNGHSLAIKSDGTIWTWGANWAGQLGDGSTDQSNTPVKVVFTEQEESLLDVRGSYFVTPGEEITYLVHYENIFGETLVDAVVTFDLPSDFTYLSSTNNGSYISDKHQVLWILGDINPDDIGYLAIKMGVSWGLTSHAKGELFVSLGAKNLTKGLDVDDYLNFSGREVISEKDLTTNEIDTLLSSDKELKDLLDYTLSLGYFFHSVARETEFSDGSSVIAFILLDPEDYGPAIIYKLGDTVFFEKYPQSKYSISVKDGGYSVDPDWTVKSWGAWAENLNPGEDKLFTSENDEDVKNCKYNFGSCMYNCQNRITGRYWSDKIKAVINGLECQKCTMSKGNDSDSCKECMKAVAKIPGIYERADTAACIDDCESSPSMHMCVNDLYRCETKTFFRKLPLIEGVLRVSMHGLSEFYTTAPVILKRECDPNTCSYTSMPEIVRYCLEGQKCYARDDGSYAECSVFLVCGGLGRIVPKSEYPLFIPEQDIPLDICPRLLKGFEVLNAHDPNAKHVDVTGNVMPGQTLNYTIEYENEGEGTAYDVFILDELCSELDENTLVINDAGEYSEASRLLSWEIGNVPGGGQGEVNFSVNVKDEISTETEIINFADVHFPSAFEITPTNAVVNTVKSIAADPQTVSAIAGAPVSTILTGRDGGSSSVTYDVTESPLCGTLTGTPPNLIYTSTDEFIGQDEFYFTVSNGTIKSDPAKVTINVVPNPSDTSSPEVTDTYPGTSVTNVHVGTTPVSEDPVQYTPTISASFSEPVDSETVTTDTFTVEGLTGYVYYDEQSRAAYFMPSTALSPSTTYTAKLSTGIKDKMGNPLASEYNWQFSTESPANIAVTIPDNADEVNFGDVLINTTSDGKIVSISSTGTEDLVLDSIMLTGTDPEEFRITEDNCSGGTLTQFMNCTVKVLCEPVSTGIKNANLSIPSNDTDEETVEITLSGTCVAESFWPALYGEMWGVDREKNLSTLRSLRDNVLSQSEMGREYIYAIYSNSLETAALLVNNPSLLIKTREVISGLMPEIQCLLEGNKEMSLSQDQLDAMERLLDEYITKASPNLRTEIMKVKRDINEGNIFNKLGIVINE